MMSNADADNFRPGLHIGCESWLEVSGWATSKGQCTNGFRPIETGASGGNGSPKLPLETFRRRSTNLSLLRCSKMGTGGSDEGK